MFIPYHYRQILYSNTIQPTSPIPGVPNTIQKEHELEIEIDRIDEFRRQGLLLRDGQRNNYEQIVRGFMDNVRLLQRQLPTRQ